MGNFTFRGMANKRCKTNHGTLCNNHENKCLKDPDIELKILWLKCSWIHIALGVNILHVLQRLLLQFLPIFYV